MYYGTLALRKWPIIPCRLLLFLSKRETHPSSPHPSLCAVLPLSLPLALSLLWFSCTLAQTHRHQRTSKGCGSHSMRCIAIAFCQRPAAFWLLIAQLSTTPKYRTSNMFRRTKRYTERLETEQRRFSSCDVGCGRTGYLFNLLILCPFSSFLQFLQYTDNLYSDLKTALTVLLKVACMEFSL